MKKKASLSPFWELNGPICNKSLPPKDALCNVWLYWPSEYLFSHRFLLHYPEKLYVPSFEQIGIFFTQVCFVEINLVVIEG